MSNVATSLFGGDVHGQENCQIEPFCLIGINGAGPVTLGKDCCLRSHSVIYAGVTLGDRVHIGHGTLIREQTIIGDDVSIGSHTMIEHHVKIGSKVRVHGGVFIPEYTIIEDEAWIGPAVVITNARLPAAKRSKEFLQGVQIGRRAKIGAGVVILPGIRIGEAALIGAGSVVTKDVPAQSVVVGAPARYLRPVTELKYPDGSPAYSE